MNITYVTTNIGKVKSLQRHLEPYQIGVIQKAVELPEPRSSDVKLIAEHKARSAYKILKEPLVVLDAGFYIPSLNGFPRAFVNFTLETIGLEGILTLVGGKERDCEFRECLAYMDGTQTEPICFTSAIKGFIAEKPKGKMQNHLWSPLALIFVPPNTGRTLGEMTPEEYASFWKDYPRESSCQKQFGEWYSAKIKS